MRGALPAICALALAAVVCLSGCGEKSEPDLSSLAQQYRDQEKQAIVGTYSGTLRQAGRKPFRVAATVASLSGSARNTVHYTGIDCSGTWSFLEHRGASYRFREKIDRGASPRCEGTGTVTLTPRGANEYSYEFRGGGVVSRGVLRRTTG